MGSCKSITRFIPATFAWLLLLTATALFFIFPAQYLQKAYHFSIVIVQGVITVFVISNFFLATFMDPGVIPKASPEEDDEDDFRAPLYRNVEINGMTVRMKWCTTCKFYRPPRCSHCSVCNTCIETFDHHCPWVNNCIGRRNYRHFFFFLVFLSIHMVTILIWCIFYVLDHRENLHDTESIISFVIIGIIVMLMLPIFGLTIFHMILVSRGRTTNEQVTGKFQSNYNPFSRGCFLNCCYILCGPNYPKYKTPKKAHRKQRHLKSRDFDSFNACPRKENVVKVFIESNEKNSNAKSLPTQFVASKTTDNGHGKLSSDMVIHSL